jgi:peptidoglycan/LPS O-acetylase OafA/YrhL
MTERAATIALPGLPRRPALDGLRALAVTGVLLYHGDVPWGRGGFLGVDVFFVLSGFLITALLLDQQQRAGQVSLGAFWAARARRLLPALGLLLVAVLWVLPWAGVRWSKQVAGDAWATAAYVSNWRFIASGQSYADQGSAPSPLLHTWSLAIEEQWYVVLPLLVVVIGLLVNRRRSRTVLTLILGVGCALSVSLSWALHSPGGDITRVYYGTDTRLQALLVGALAAVLLGPRVWAAGESGSRLPWLAAPGLAGLVILAALASPGSDWLYRGGLLAVAVCAALVVVGLVSAGESQGGLAGVFSLRPVVALGLISYGVYLWHWPVVLVLDEDRAGFGGPGLFAARVAVTLAVATVSYVVVERPVRQRIWRRVDQPMRQWVPALTGGLALVVAALVFPVGAAAVAPDSLAALAGVAATASASPSPDPSPGAQSSGGPTGPSIVVLVGDSQALSLFAAVKDRPGDGLTLRLATRLGCGVTPYTAAVGGVELHPQQPLCGDWARTRETEIAAAQADVGVLFAGTWEEYDRSDAGVRLAYSSAQWQRETTAAYRTVLAEMSRHVRHLAIVLDHCHRAPTSDLPVATLYQWGRYAPVVNDPRRIAAQNAALRAAAAGFDGVTVLDPGTLLCAHGYSATLGSVRLRTDGVHWTAAGARLVWGWMRPQLLAGLRP